MNITENKKKKKIPNLDDFINAYLVAKWKGLPMDGSDDDDKE